MKYTLALEFADYENAATVNLTWSSPAQYKEVIPASQLCPANPPPTPTRTPTQTSSPSTSPIETQAPNPTTQAPSGQVRKTPAPPDYGAPVIFPVREWAGYYYAGSQRVAVRVTGSANPQENGLFYTVGDHLGSTSLVVDSAGNKASEKRYTP